MIIPNIEELSQEEIIAQHLIHEGNISSIEAISEYGITRLSAKIHTLRKRGWNIDTVPENGKNRFGKRTNYGRYIFKGEQ